MAADRAPSRAERFIARPLLSSGQPYDDRDKRRALAEARVEIAGLGDGQSLVFLAESDPLAFAVRFFALLDAGHCPVALPPDVGSYQLEQLRAGFRDRAAWWTAGEWSRAGDGSAAADAEPGNFGCLTSGTTAHARLCLLSAASAEANARAHAESLGIGAEHRLLQTLPLHHSFGLTCYLFASLELGCALDFSPAFLTLRALRKRTVDRAVLHTSPAQVRFMLREPDVGPIPLEILSVGGGLVHPRELAALQDRLPATRLFVTYGLTEAGPRVSSGRFERAGTGASRRHGFIGRAIPGVTVGVQSERGELRSSGVGLLCVRSPSLKRYLALDERAADGESLLTRDWVELTPEGEIVFLCRRGDLVKVGGISVYPKEIEEVVRRHPDVTDCAVLARGDDVYEEVLDLFVESEVAGLDIDRFLRGKLTLAQWPRGIFVVPTLPRTALGKVDTVRLRQLVGASDADLDVGSQLSRAGAHRDQRRHHPRPPSQDARVVGGSRDRSARATLGGSGRGGE
jgi:acyl-CoA synthetase (AMP-forming)/AMP-acid ligase II